MSRCLPLALVRYRSKTSTRSGSLSATDSSYDSVPGSCSKTCLASGRHNSINLSRSLFVLNVKWMSSTNTCREVMTILSITRTLHPYVC